MRLPIPKAGKDDVFRKLMAWNRAAEDAFAATEQEYGEVTFVKISVK